MRENILISYLDLSEFPLPKGNGSSSGKIVVQSAVQTLAHYLEATILKNKAYRPNTHLLDIAMHYNINIIQLLTYMEVKSGLY